MTAREVFHAVMTVGLLIVLAVGLSQLNWVAVGWACFGLLGSLTAIAQERRDRRKVRS